MTRRRARNKNNSENGSEMTIPAGAVPGVNPSTSVSSSPEGHHHHEPPSSEKSEVHGDGKVIEIVEKTEKLERLPLVLWRNPVTVIHYSSCELVLSLLEGAQALLKYKASLTITTVALSKGINIIF